MSLLAAGIINYHEYEDTRRCIDLLMASGRRPDRILVADNESEPGRAAELVRRLGADNVLASPANRGYSGGANAILRETRDAEFTLLLNPDVRVGPRYCLDLLRAAESSPRSAVFGGKLVRPDGRTLDSTGTVAWRNTRIRDRASGKTDDGRFERPEEVFGATGAAILLRRQALEEIRIGDEYFDEDFFLYHEDSDLCWRLRLAGWKALYVPSAVAEHTRAWRIEERQGLSRLARGHSFKNHYLKLVKNILPAQAARDGLHILGLEALRLGYAALREPFLLGYAWDAVTLLPRAFRKRHAIMRRRRVGWRELSRWFI
jgi:GT2 family glycosyltransferase